jgi:hypothetical protein
VLFGDLGTGWLSQNTIGALHGDAGIGIEIGSFGVYAAKAFTSEPLRIAVRIQRRF